MSTSRLFRLLRELKDVDTSGAAPGDALVLDADGETWIPGAGGGGGGSDDQTAAEVPFTPAGGIASTDVQAALVELDTEKASASSFADHSARHEDGGADEISVAGLSGLLATAQTPTAHVHAGEDITAGTVADARIASTIARDSEVSAAITAHEAASDPHPTYTTAAELAAYAQPLDSDLTAIGGLSPTNDDLIQRKSGAWTNRTIAQLLVDLAAAGTTFQPLDSDLTSIAALATTSYGRALLALADAAALRTAGGLVIGTDVEAHDADLTTIAGLSPANDDVLQRKSGAWTNRTLAQLLTDLGISSNDAVQDVLGTPDTAFEFESSSFTGLTALGTPDAEDAHTTIPHHYYVRDDDSAWVGRWLGSLTAPFTAVTKIGDSVTIPADGRKVGLFVGDSSPALSADADVILVGNSGTQIWVELASTTNITSSAQTGLHGRPIYLAIRVNSSTDVDYLWSIEGRIWTKIVDSRNPGIGTLSTVGIAVTGTALIAAAYDYLRIWNSAKSFPGALA